jgi:hypothetical protein
LKNKKDKNKLFLFCLFISFAFNGFPCVLCVFCRTGSAF